MTAKEREGGRDGWVHARNRSTPVTAEPLCIQCTPHQMAIQGASGLYEAEGGGETPTHTKLRSLPCCTQTDEGGREGRRHGDVKKKREQSNYVFSSEQVPVRVDVAADICSASPDLL